MIPWIPIGRDPVVDNAFSLLYNNISVAKWKRYYKEWLEQYKGTKYQDLMAIAILPILKTESIFFTIATNAVLAGIYDIRSLRQIRDIMIYAINNDDDRNDLNNDGKQNEEARIIMKAVVAIYPYNHPIYKQIYPRVKREMSLAKRYYGDV